MSSDDVIDLGNITIQELKGTASVLSENSAYNKLEGLIGENGAKNSIQQQMLVLGITTEEFETFRKVNQKMLNHPLGAKIALEIHKLIDEYEEASG